MISGSLWSSEQIEQMSEREPYKNRVSTLLSVDRKDVSEEGDYLWTSFLNTIYADKEIYIPENLNLNQDAQAYLAFKKQVASDLVDKLKKNGFDFTGKERQKLESILSHFTDKMNRSSSYILELMNDLPNLSEQTKNTEKMFYAHKYSAYLNAGKYYEAAIQTHVKYIFYMQAFVFLRDHSLFAESEVDESKFYFASLYRQHQIDEVNRKEQEYNGSFSAEREKIKDNTYNLNSVRTESLKNSMEILCLANDLRKEEIKNIIEKYDVTSLYRGLVVYEEYFYSKMEKWGTRFKQHAEQSGDPTLKSLATLVLKLSY